MLSVTDLNRMIDSLNQITQGTQNLASLFSQLAWEKVEDHAGASGTRPQVVESVSTVSVPDVPGGQPPSSVVSLEEVRGVLADLSRQGLTEQIKSLLASLGVSRLSEVKQDDLTVLLQKAKGLKNGA